MDTIHAPMYDERWGAYINQTHRACVEALLGRVRRGGGVLDAGCGTGKYWPMLLDAGVRVVGVDHSAAMLQVARAKHPDVPVTRSALQDLASLDLAGAMDGLICIDAMENVGPEDWPGVVEGLAAVLRPAAPAYVTIELPDDDISPDLEAETAPLVAGEVLEDGGYHFYPPIGTARAWLTEHGFAIWSETEGDGYHHFLLTRS